MDDFADNGSLLLYLGKCTNGYLAAQALCFEFLETSEERRGKSGSDRRNAGIYNLATAGS